MFLCKISGNEQKRQRLASSSEMFKVQMRFASQISMQLVDDPKRGRILDDCNSLRVLDTVLRQQALKQYVYIYMCVS